MYPFGFPYDTALVTQCFFQTRLKQLHYSFTFRLVYCTYTTDQLKKKERKVRTVKYKDHQVRQTRSAARNILSSPKPFGEESCKEYHLRPNPSVKKGCLNASCAVKRSARSYFSSPCKRSMKSPAAWSTFCITRFCHEHRQHRHKFHVLTKWMFCQALLRHTWSLDNFITAFILSREVQPSGQFRRPFLMYLSLCRLQTRINKHKTSTRPHRTDVQTTLVWNILCPLKHMVRQRSENPLHHSQMFQVFVSLE